MEGKNNFHKGSVWIVGAGPGDPGLLTMHAVKAIRLADTIFYDALINNEILHLSKPHAKLIYVGKRANKHSINQLEISSKLISESKKNILPFVTCKLAVSKDYFTINKKKKWNTNSY